MEWCYGEINHLLDTKKYIKLCEKRLCVIYGKEYYLSAFEYGLFSTPEMCARLSFALHSMGFISSDMVTPFMSYLAAVKGFSRQSRQLATIVWSKPVILGLLKRPDAYQILKCRNTVTGYEFALHDKHLVRKVGELIMEENLRISDVICFAEFRAAPPEHIRQLLCL